MQTSLKGIAKRAKEDKNCKFRSLNREITPKLLYECFEDMNRKSSVGVDGVDYDEYKGKLDTNLRSLLERVENGTYHASLVRRHYIPKGNGKVRPLGIPTTEDKLLQRAVRTILEAIYEQDFLPSSFGYRPKRSARNAVDELQRELNFGGYNWLVEADIKGFFDNINQEKLLDMLRQRIDDESFIKLIQKWLRAGVLDTDGKIIDSLTGTPQGGVISPMLANIYMHYVLNEWFENMVKKHCKGKAYLCVYADDFVCAFEHEKDARKFYGVLPKRLAKYNLEIAPEKTKLIKFSKKESATSETFDFLGFEFRWVKARLKNSYFVLRRSAKKRFMRAIDNVEEWLKENRSQPITILIKKLNRKLVGYYNYFGVPGNYEGIKKYSYIVRLRLHKWLGRRSQRGSYTWKAFNNLLKALPLAKPMIRY